MPPVKILTDSTADLPPNVAERLGITVLPISIHLGQKTLRDGVDTNPADFIGRLTHVPAPTTSPPTIKQFEEAFTELTQEG